jgi:ubiquinone/menaquinone biosynthesis C-methylase UbiE
METDVENAVTEEAVKDANRRLYDAVASQYEGLDGRRSPALERWLRRRLAGLRARAPGGRLLDIGSGSGFVARCAKGIFDYRAGTDISAAILEANREAFDYAVAADADALPFEDGSFDMVSCFAVLHHLFSFDGLVREAHRVLKPGGILYTDHDMDVRFHRRFRLPLAAYRRLRNAAAKYRQASAAVTEEVYRLSECHEAGIEAADLAVLLSAEGFSAHIGYHWFGLSPLTDALFRGREYPRGWAPLIRIVATR